MATASSIRPSMSESTFAALESTLLQDAVDSSALADENARLRELLAAHTSQPTIILSPSADEPAHSSDSPSFPFPAVASLSEDLVAQLAAEKATAAEMARELAALKAFQRTVVKHAVEDHDDELSFLRQSLATLASALEDEKARVSRIEDERKKEETARRAEEDKVHTLRKTVDESRRALMRLQNEASKRTSVDFSAPSPVNRRLSVGGVYDSTPKRRSSLGPAPLTVGLGLSAESPERSPAMLLSSLPSSSSHGKQSSLLRATHRRGSASVAVMDSGEEDRANRLRDLRLNVNTMKVHSRRNSAASTSGDLLSPTEGPERTRIPSFSFPQGTNPFGAMHRTHSISEESEGSSAAAASRRGSNASWIERGPPSAPLRAAGRNNSVAMFEAWSRRSSNASDVSFSGYNGFGAPGMMRRLSMGSMTGSESGYESVAEASQLKMEVQGLRIQLAEAEEGRRASELCLNALKEYIQTGSDGTLSLPPLPTEREKPAPSSWSISSFASSIPTSLPFSNRKPSALASPSVLSFPGARGSPNLTSFDKPRTASVSSVASTANSHATPNAGPGAPIFGGFSFSALVSRGSTIVDGDTSPTMTGQADAEGAFPTEPSPLLPQDEDDTTSVAPSLTSASECGDSESSRSSSPVGDQTEEGADAIAIAGEFGKLVLNEQGTEFVLPPLAKDADPTTPRLGLGVAC